MPKVNPEILVWARESAGLDQEEAVGKLKLSDTKKQSALEKLRDLESGEKAPTRPLLVKMAKQYRRPLLVFYLSKPPARADRGSDFRTLPQRPAEVSRKEESVLDALIRSIRVRQELVKAALFESEEAEPLDFVGRGDLTDASDAARQLRETFEFDLKTFRSRPSIETAFAYLRGQVEARGVFVLLQGDLGSHHSALSLDVFRGFAIADSVAPFIVINDKDAKGAWAFTLIHELAHIWLGETGVSGQVAENRIEKFCNSVAGEALVPSSEFAEFRNSNVSSFEDIKAQIVEFAKARRVSNSMVAYRLLLLDMIPHQLWQGLAKSFRDDWIESKERESGTPDYYVVRRHRIGPGLLNFASRMLQSGTLTTTKVSRVLGVKPSNVGALLGQGATG